ncbi:MAG TPA: transketolase, partial [Candidatus Binatia bacterium]|nr:transketolase [Candidatus Binatia bacterium]
DRDRFVLSAGHGSMLLYVLLYLTGYDLSLDDLKQFRQWGSRTPGHPESHLTAGVEATTGPLGQGLANSIGFAIAEEHLAARYNRPGHTVIDHRTWVLCSDGDLMEGVTAEACSLAGHLQLGKLIALYDDNHISLSGTTSLTFSEDTAKRFAAYGWHVQHVPDGNDLTEIDGAIRAARHETERPSLILVHTTIGYGAPHKEGTYEAHGSPLGPDELKAAKENLGWPTEPAFLVPPEAGARFREAVAAGKKLEAEWKTTFDAYAKAFPAEAAELERRVAGTLPDGWDADVPVFPADAKGVATRKASESVMQALAPRLPDLMGGSADLNPSTFTWLKKQGDFQPASLSEEGVQGRVGGPWGPIGRNVHFGVRENAMGSAVNGMALHGGFVPYGSTFLVFSDYMRPAVRLSAISKLGTIWVYTHDSVGVGEDGPTHQPIEHYAALRAIPDLLFFRPGDANETALAWRIAVENRHRPSILALTRQNLPTLDRTVFASADGVRRGAYVLNPGVTSPDLLLLATGSEVHLIVEAAEILEKRGIRARLVSMPCWELFREQPDDYRESVLPTAVRKRVGVESGVSLGWDRWVGLDGTTVTIDRFGASAPGERVMKELGLTVEHVVEKAQALVR